MILSDFDYPLPKELIAQEPLKDRDASRLLVVDRHESPLQDRHFSNLVDLIPAGDVLVLNDTKVFQARLMGKKKLTGGKVDILLLEPFVGAIHELPLHGQNRWRCLVQPSLKEGQEILLDEGAEARLVGRDETGVLIVQFGGTDDVRAFAERNGQTPLPPYIKRRGVLHTPQNAHAGRDVGRDTGRTQYAPTDDIDKFAYQTVYAQHEGAVAAPTAGLHFTRELLEKIKQKGVEILTVTLHVGYGTFRPVEDLENHRMHAENFELSKETAEKINKAREEKKKIWAVGTTTLRVLETCVQKKKLIPGSGKTDLFIKEPFVFEAVDHLITNFHLPKTTLLLLVSAFMGEGLRKKAYQHAIQERYRFYSYGDAMVIL